ncbi:MAG: carbohydrate binding domain-containing protein, partial [Phycisphaerales bacterium]|nr:carbohydrate binding domain-containing protein [Phycisphaerales bacterium]
RGHVMTHGPSCSTPSSRRRRGFSLVEATISLTIVSVMVLASMNAVSGAVESAQRGPQMHLATRLAEDLLHEITAQHYAEPTDTGTLPFADDPGERDTGDRSLFDDVDDYAGWSASPPEMKDGTAITRAEGWTRSVKIDRLNASTFTSTTAETGLKQITVVVTDPAGVTTTLVGLRSRAGMVDNASLARAHTHWMEVDVQSGSNGKTVYHTSARLLNQPTALSVNLVTNGTFEDGIAPWKPDSGVTLSLNNDAAAGANSLAILGVGTLQTEGAWQEIPANELASGRTYTASASVRSISALPITVSFDMTFDTTDGTTTISSASSIAGSSWTDISATIKAVWTGDLNKAYFRIKVLSMPARVDQISLTENFE